MSGEEDNKGCKDQVQTVDSSPEASTPEVENGWQQRLLQEVQELQCQVQQLQQHAQPQPPLPEPGFDRTTSKQQVPLSSSTASWWSSSSSSHCQLPVTPVTPSLPAAPTREPPSQQLRQHPPTAAQQPQQKSLVDSLIEGGKPDVYAFTVSIIIQGQRGWKVWKALLALLFTLGLQMGLLLLLWQGLVAGSGIFGDQPESDKLWWQVGQVQRQVCWLHQHAAMNASVPADAEVDCSWAWPEGPQCQNNMHFVDFKQCMMTLGKSLFSKEEVERACEGFFNMSSALRAFGDGLLFPSYLQPVAGVNVTGPQGPWSRLSSGGWAGNWDSRTQCSDCDEVAEIISSQQGCMPNDLYSGRNPSYTNLLAFLALVVYVHEDIKTAVFLGYVVATYSGILPDFFFPVH